MNKSYIVVLISIGLLFISACETETTGSGPFKGGTDGLEVSFVDSAPPSSFNQDDTVPIRIRLQNNGESDIAAGEAAQEMKEDLNKALKEAGKSPFSSTT